MEAPNEDPQGGAPPQDLTNLLSSGPNDRVEVQCNGMPGTLLITTQAIVCKCAECQKQPSAPQAGMGGRVMTPTEFERHSGMCSSKKWRRSIKVVIPNGRGGRAAVSVGRWLEQHGYSVQDKKEDKKEDRKEKSGRQPAGRDRDRDRERDRDQETETENEPDQQLRPPADPFYFMRPMLPPAFAMHQHAAAAAAAAALMQPHAAAALALFGGCAPPVPYEESDDSEALRPPGMWPPVQVMPGHSPVSATPRKSQQSQQPFSRPSSTTKKAKRPENNNEDVLLAANALGLLKARPNSGSSGSPGASSEGHGEGVSRNGPRDAVKAEQLATQPTSGSSRHAAASPQQPSSAKAAKQSSGLKPQAGKARQGQEQAEMVASPNATPAKQKGSARKLGGAGTASLRSGKAPAGGRRGGGGHDDPDASNSESDSAARHAGTSSGVHGSGGSRGMRSMFPIAAMPPFGMSYAHPGFMPMMYDPMRAASMQQQQQMYEMSGRAVHQMHKAAAAAAGMGMQGRGTGSATKKGRAGSKRKFETEELIKEDAGEGEDEEEEQHGGALGREEDEDDCTPLAGMAAHMLGHSGAGYMPGGRRPMIPPGPMFMNPYAAAAMAGARKMYGGGMVDDKMNSPAAVAAAAQMAMGMNMGMGMGMNMNMGMGNFHQRGGGGFPMMMSQMMMQPGQMGGVGDMPMQHGRRTHGQGGRRGRAAVAAAAEEDEEEGGEEGDEGDEDDGA